MGRDHRRTAARAALLALGAVAIGGCATAASQPVTIRVETAPATTAAVAAAAPVTPATDPADVKAAPAASPPAAESRLTLRTPPGAYPVIWVKPHREVELRTAPRGGAPVARVGRESDFGSPSVFGVVRKRGNWAGVSTRRLANNQLAWVKLDPARIEYGWTRYSITVDLSARRAALYRGGRIEFTFPVTVGAPGSDTPSGRFAVTDTFTGLDSAAYGCCALALSATQPNLPSGWLGGSTIAIHGTSGPLGIAASHGCVRAADAEVAKLVRTVPLGTPVIIRS